MGWYISRINDVTAEYHDSFWSYIKHNKPKEYYDNESCDVTIKVDGKEFTESVPLDELVDIKLVKKNYDWEWNDKKTLKRWLFNYLTAKGEKIECYVYATLGTFNLEYEKPLVEGYYLQTEIGDENIVLSTVKKLHEIKSYDDFEWIRYRLLAPSYKDKK